MWVTSAPSSRSTPKRSAWSRRSIPGSITIARAAPEAASLHSTSAADLVRWLRRSRERQTAQRQPTRGTPRLAPQPMKVTRVAARADALSCRSAALSAAAALFVPLDVAGSGRRVTQAGPPMSARSSASFANASARPFCSRGTWRALHCEKRTSSACASSRYGANFASRTFQRAEICSTTSLESRRRSTSLAPSSTASSRPETTAFHSATLFVVVPIAAEIVAIGVASWRSAPSAVAS